MTQPAEWSLAAIGAGSWGTALAALLARKYPAVTIWCREPEVAAGINRDHRNPQFVSGHQLPSGLRATTDLAATCQHHQLLVVTIPTQFYRATLRAMLPHLHPECVIVSASKGIELESLAPISTIIAEELGTERAGRVCYLSGPSFAQEVLQEQPTAVTVAGVDPRLVHRVQELFFTSSFRTYGSGDVIGVELGGALKNVIALAAGICDGLGFGYNARAALITRGLAEMIRLGVAMGGDPRTFSGLSGLGDLLLTATADLSRNRTVGRRLGAGESLAAIQSTTREVAEGVATTASAWQLAQRLGVEMPIVQAVYEILYAHRDPRTEVARLMERELKSE